MLRNKSELPTVTLAIPDFKLLLVRYGDDELTVAEQEYTPDCSLPNDLIVAVVV